MEQLRKDIAAAVAGASQKAVTVDRIRTTFFIKFTGTGAGSAIPAMSLTDSAFTLNDIVGTAQGFITHDVTLEVGVSKDSINNLFVQGTVAAQRPGSASVMLDTAGSEAGNEVQIVTIDATDGNFKIMLGDKVSEEMLFIPLDPEKVRRSIETAINALDGIDAVVTPIKIGAADDYSYRVEFVGETANTSIGALLQVDTTNLTKGERTLKVVGGCRASCTTLTATARYLKHRNKTCFVAQPSRLWQGPASVRPGW